MAPPSSLVILAITVWSSSHILLAQSLEVGKLSHEQDSRQSLIKNGKLRNLANELAMDYLFEDNNANLQPDVTLAKRDPPSVKREDVADDDIRSMYQHFVRRNIPPSLVKFNYGKRSDDKRYQTPFIFGKRDNVDHQIDNGLINEAKRKFSPFVFGKREMELPNWDDKRARYNPFFFGKRYDVDDMDKRGGFSTLYFGKRVPEMAKKGFSKLYFGKRDLSDTEKRFSKFIFGKRERYEDNETPLNESDKKMAGNFELESRDDLSADKRYKPAFYFGKRATYPDEQENTNNMNKA